MSRTNRHFVLLSFLGLAPAAHAQVASALLRELDPLPSHPGFTIEFINNTAANRTGGYSATIGSTDGVTDLSHVWGSATGGAPGTMRTENPSLSGYAQTAFETFYGMDDVGSLSYGPTCNDLVGGLGSGLDCVWLDDTPLGVEDMVVPTMPSVQWRFNSRPGITGNGIPYWVGGIDLTGTSTSAGEALFVGTGIGIPLKTGDVIPGVANPVTSIGFGVRLSGDGTHYILQVTTSAATSINTHIVLDGQVLQTTGATPFSKGALVPVGSGGNGVENWEFWDFVHVNEAGDTFVMGDTTAATSADGFLAKNGAMVYREGQVLDGVTLSGNPSTGGFMDESGSVTFTWDTGGTTTNTGLFHDSTLLVKEGDEIDWDGDGIVDTGHVLTAFTGITSVTAGNSTPGGATSAVYFTADVVVGPGGPTLEGFFRISLENAGAPFCAGDGSLTDHTTPCPCGNDGIAGHGCGHSFDASGALLDASGDAASDTIVLHSSFEPVSSFTLFMQHASPGDTVFHDGVLCAGNPLIRLRGRSAVAGEGFFPNSNFAQDSTTTLSIRGGTFPGSGATMRYAAWYRNASSTFCPPATANVTNGWVVTW